MNTAEYLIKKLEELGINDFFGVPGDYNFDLLYAIEKNQNTNWIGCTNELNAGYAADGYARQNGYGAVITTFGVGELSAINAISGSYAENVPVISIVGIPNTQDIENQTLLHHNLHKINYKAYAEAHKTVVESVSFLNRDNAKIEIDNALKRFVKEKRPVYIAIPMDIATMEISNKSIDYNWYSNEENLEKAVLKINEKIKKAKNPVILGDVLIKRYNSKIEFKEFVDKSKIPTTNFIMGSNLISQNCENYLGTYLGDFENLLAKNELEKTDCLISVGVIYSDLNSFGFKLPYKINSQIAIYGTYTIIENERFDNIKMSDVLDRLTKIIEPIDRKIEKEVFGYKPSKITEGKLTSEYIYPRLQEFFKENDIIIAETGIIPYGLYKMSLPNNVEIITQTLYGSIGWATPATLGVCKANPNSRVILLTGDGAHQMTAMEIGSILKQGHKPIIIVLNNQGYTTERFLSENFEDNFNDIVQINYSKFVRVFDGDIWATRVETADDFDKALKVTRIMNKLCYIEICIDKLDLSELTYKVLSNYKNKYDKISNKIIEKKEKKFKLTLKKNEKMEFETKVHESLRYEVE